MTCMSQDYFDLYQSQKSAAPPEPPAAFPMASAPASSGESEPQPTPFVLKSSDAALPPPLPDTPYASTFPPPPKQKQPFSPIPLLLIAGVAFLFLGGLIFLTNTWATLPDLVRAIALLSVGIISFGVNALAERVFQLPKTGLAFYILGCIFLPMAVAGIGAFSLFGDWFSF
ncbi:MAG: hypothetical protein IIU04_06265, partial [Bacteroidales bacterium]|nr:hypothetical protein [Bacteroidales bacterium]